MNNRSFYPLAMFVVLLIIAIVLGNALLSFLFQRPIDEVPSALKFIVHGVSLTILAVVAKKVFIR